MNNFQLVLIWRDDDTKSFFLFKVANLSGNKQSMMHDSYFTAHIFKFRFGKPNQPNQANFFSNLLEPFHTVQMVGDHGVISKQGLWHESMLQTKYEKTIYVLSLRSDHAPNRADDASGQAKQLALMAAKAKRWMNTAQDFAVAVTESDAEKSVCFSFPQIDRSKTRYLSS